MLGRPYMTGLEPRPPVIEARTVNVRPVDHTGHAASPPTTRNSCGLPTITSALGYLQRNPPSSKIFPAATTWTRAVGFRGPVAPWRAITGSPCIAHIEGKMPQQKNKKKRLAAAPQPKHFPFPSLSP